MVPVTVSVVAADPATTDFGLIDAMVGPVTVNGEEMEVAPPGFCTVTPRLPAVPSRVLGMVAVMDVAVPAVTLSAVAPM